MRRPYFQTCLNEQVMFNHKVIPNIEGFHQWGTYRRLLEGTPMRSMNNGILHGTLESAIHLTKCNRIYMIPPIITHRRSVRADYSNCNDHFESLPKVTCIANLEYYSKNGPSHLALVWFQNDYAMPIDTMILKQINSIKWNEVANFEEYYN